MDSTPSSRSEGKKFGKITAEAGKPLQFTELAAPSNPGDIPPHLGPEIGETFRAYGRALKSLLSGKYGHLKKIASPHMTGPVSTTIVKCTDGILVRYDTVSDTEAKVRSGAVNKPLSEIAPGFTEQMIHFPPSIPEFVPPPGCAEIIVDRIRPSTGEKVEVFRLTPLILATTDLPIGFEIPKPPGRPPCLASVVNEFEVELHGAITSQKGKREVSGRSDSHFVIRSCIRLAVGWQCVEIYPLLGNEHWRPEYAPLWAELDLLAFACQRNLRLSQLRALDPRSEIRKQYSATLREFAELLNGKEEPIHQFLKSHPEIICPTADRIWSKLAFGDHISDFVAREPHYDYELIEIEAPFRELFRNDGQQRQELTHAIDQIRDWVQFIEDNRTHVEKVLGLEGISTSPRKLVVIGRSGSLTPENRRKLITLQNDHARLRILTYDDLLAIARANLERILGPLDLVGSNAEVYLF